MHSWWYAWFSVADFTGKDIPRWLRSRRCQLRPKDAASSSFKEKWYQRIDACFTIFRPNVSSHRRFLNIWLYSSFMSSLALDIFYAKLWYKMRMPSRYGLFRRMFDHPSKQPFPFSNTAMNFRKAGTALHSFCLEWKGSLDQTGVSTLSSHIQLRWKSTPVSTHSSAANLKRDM